MFTLRHAMGVIFASAFLTAACSAASTDEPEASSQAAATAKPRLGLDGDVCSKTSDCLSGLSCTAGRCVRPCVELGGACAQSASACPTGTKAYSNPHVVGLCNDFWLPRNPSGNLCCLPEVDAPSDGCTAPERRCACKDPVDGLPAHYCALKCNPTITWCPEPAGG